MTTISTAAPAWLALRGPADAASRSATLARALARLVGPGPVVVHDLGAGTGSMTRWLAPRLPGPQQWVLHDGDAGILPHLDIRSVVDGAGRPVAADVVVEHLELLPLEAFQGASVVTASALLDVITEAEAQRAVAACVDAGAPTFFSLSVTGSVRMDPPALDGAMEAAIGAAFNDHQRRDAAGRRMLGPDAVSVVAHGFADAGWEVRRRSTPWRLGAPDAALIAEWLDGWVDAAVEQRPALGQAAEAYRRRRHAENAAGVLRVTVSHEDLLAWPSRLR